MSPEKNAHLGPWCQCGRIMRENHLFDGYTCACGGFLSGKDLAEGKWQTPEKPLADADNPLLELLRRPA